MASGQSKIIIILGAVVLAVITASAAALWLLPSPDEGSGLLSEDQAQTSPVASTEVPPTSPGDDRAVFNTTVLRTKRYTTLDQQLVTDGSLPVQPPAAVGKANPFL